jgi:hypothetical protein
MRLIPDAVNVSCASFLSPREARHVPGRSPDCRRAKEGRSSGSNFDGAISDSIRSIHGPRAHGTANTCTFSFSSGCHPGDGAHIFISVGYQDPAAWVMWRKILSAFPTPLRCWLRFERFRRHRLSHNRNRPTWSTVTSAAALVRSGVPCVVHLPEAFVSESRRWPDAAGRTSGNIRRVHHGHECSRTVDNRLCEDRVSKTTIAERTNPDKRKCLGSDQLASYAASTVKE